MKELIESIKNVSRDMSEGRLNSDIIKDLPKDRLDVSDYIFTFNFDLLGMNGIDKINTLFLSILIIGVFFFYGASGVVVLFGILALGTLWSTYKLHSRRTSLIDEVHPYQDIVKSGDYEIDSPYIIAKSPLLTIS